MSFFDFRPLRLGTKQTANLVSRLFLNVSKSRSFYIKQKPNIYQYNRNGCNKNADNRMDLIERETNIYILYVNPKQSHALYLHGKAKWNMNSMRGSRVGTGGPDPPWKITEKLFFSNTDTNPQKNHELPGQHLRLGHHWRPSQTPFQWRFAGAPIMVSLKLVVYPHQSIQKSVVKVVSPLTKLSG